MSNPKPDPALEAAKSMPHIKQDDENWVFAPVSKVAVLIRQAYAEREAKVQELCNLVVEYRWADDEERESRLEFMFNSARSLREEG